MKSHLDKLSKALSLPKNVKDELGITDEVILSQMQTISAGVREEGKGVASEEGTIGAKDQPSTLEEAEEKKAEGTLEGATAQEETAE